MGFQHIYKINARMREYLEGQPSEIPYKVNYKIIFSPDKGEHLILFARKIEEQAGMILIFDCWSYGNYYPNMCVSGVPYISYKLTAEDL